MINLATSTTDSTTGGSSFGIATAIVVAGLFIAGGIYFGLQGLPVDFAAVKTGTTAATPTLSPSQPVPNSAPSMATVSVDDDAVLGNADAPVTIIEFSDYECPFCKRHFDEAYPSLKREYIDTGKVKLVYRDLPLFIHDPMATTEAIAANCAREQGDDATYYAYHDEMFTRTTSNGNGLSVEKLYTIASDLGLNATKLQKCVEDKKYADEVSKDLADAQTAGANGTPTFFIGKSTPTGIISAEIVVGAVPYPTLKSLIDKYIN